MRRSAVISLCELYRRELRRIWDDALPLLIVCMLNPSRADSERDDPTMLALIHFARLWGYGGVLVINLYDFRSSSPSAMFAQDMRMSVENVEYQIAALDLAIEQKTPVLVAWGNDGSRENADKGFIEAAAARGIDLVCLGLTASGAPKHPAARGQHRIPRDQRPFGWKAAA